MHTWSFSCSVCKGLLPDLTEKLFWPEICSEATNTTNAKDEKWQQKDNCSKSKTSIKHLLLKHRLILLILHMVIAD